MTMNPHIPAGPAASGRIPGSGPFATGPEHAAVGDLVRTLPHLRLRPECPVERVLSAMSSTGRQIAGIIEEDGTFSGFITRSTLIGKLVMDQGLEHGGAHIRPATLRGLTAADVMIRNPAFLPSELSISDALAIMTEYGHPVMPVLGDHGELIGLAEIRQLRRACHVLETGPNHPDHAGLGRPIPETESPDKTRH